MSATEEPTKPRIKRFVILVFAVLPALLILCYFGCFAGDFDTPDGVYALYSRSLKTGDLKTARSCLIDNAKGLFSRIVEKAKEPECKQAIKQAAAQKPGTLVRKLASPNGLCVTLVYREDDRLVGVVFRKPPDLKRWAISSWNGDWQQPPPDNDAAAEAFVYTGPRSLSWAHSLGMARATCKAPGATVRWYDPADLRDDETTVRLPKREFTKVGRIFEKDQEKITVEGVVPIFPKGSIACAICTRKEAKETWTIRMVDVKSRQTLWEKPWPGGSPKGIPRPLTDAGFHFRDGALWIPQAGGQNPQRMDPVTGGLLEGGGLKLPRGRGRPFRLGVLKDGREVWASTAKEARKVPAVKEGDWDTSVHIGKPGQEPGRNLVLRTFSKAASSGQVLPIALIQNSILVCLVRHKDRRTTLFAQPIEEKTPLWKRKIDRPLLTCKVRGNRLYIGYGEIVHTQQPVWALLSIGSGTEVIALKDGKTLYSFPKAKNEKDVKVNMVASLLYSLKGVDLYRGAVGKRMKHDVLFAVRPQTGDTLWQTDEVSVDYLAHVDEQSGIATAMNTSGWGYQFELQSGRQVAYVTSQEGELEGNYRDCLFNFGRLWVTFETDVYELRESFPRPPAPPHIDRVE